MPRIGGRARLVLCVSATVAASGLAPGPGTAQEEGASRRQEASTGLARPIDPDTFPRPSARAVRTRETIVVDGRLDEAAWGQADTISGFVQNRPDLGLPATERTVVHILYDDDHIYIGAICYDSRPEEIVARSLRREFPSGDEDVFGVALGPFGDRRNGYMFGVNANGAFRDIQVTDDGQRLNFDWEGIVRRAARLHEQGWSLELAIPLTTIRFDASKPVQVWDLNFIRRIRRKGEDSFWAPLNPRSGLFRFSRAGSLSGLEGLEGGLDLSVKAYALATRSSSASVEDPDGTGFDGGFDIKYGVTRQLTLDLTYRTDFAQVEVDEERLNLTRFSLFFPEQRDFFLENMGMFDFGDQSPPGYRQGVSPESFSLFHSRRIGLEGGEPVPIVGGTRLTGRVGDFEVGFLDMQTKGVEHSPAENFGALRVRRELLDVVQVGGMFLNRQATGDRAGGDFNRSYGVDANIRLFDRLLVQSYVAGSSDGDAETGGDSRATRLSVGWRDGFWDTSVILREIGDAFRPEMGFVRRTGIRQGYGTVGVHLRPAWTVLNELNPYVEIDNVDDLASALATRTGTVGMDVEFRDRSQLTVQAKDRLERIERPFEPVPGVEIPIGEYDFREASVSYRSSRGRAVSGRIEVGGGGYFGGERQSVDAAALWKPSKHVSVDLSGELNVLELGGDTHSAEVGAIKVLFAHSTRLYGDAFVQYNGATEELVSNIRVNFIHSPLSDLFLVYTERRDVAAGRVLDRAVTAKLTKFVSF